MTLTGEELFEIVGISLLFGGPLIGWIVYTVASKWRDVRLAEQAAVLKKDMLDRGMSADEIAAVLAAGQPDKPGKTDVVLKMIKNGYDSEHVIAVRAAVDRLTLDEWDEVQRAATAMANNGYDGKDIAKFVEEKVAAGNPPPGVR